jgi:carbamoylphosphate synthase large subunit
LRIAFIRSVDINQANPTLFSTNKYIKENNITAKLFYTDGLCNESLFPGEFEKVSPNTSINELVEKILEWKPDSVISISLPDDNSLRDSIIKEFLEGKHNIPVIAHPLSTTSMLCNKWETNQTLRSLGYEVPNSVLVHGDLINKRGIEYRSYIDSLLCKLNELTFPVVTKPLWDSMSSGVNIFYSINEIRSWLEVSPPSYDIMVEEFIDGQLFGIEVVGMDNRYITQPLIRIYNGDKEKLTPFDHSRYGPEEDLQIFSGELESMLKKIASELRITGSVEFDLIFKNGTFYIIEINPRVSGLTNLSSAISGFNTYELLLSMALGQWNQVSINQEQKEFTVEFPLINMSDELIEILKSRYKIFHVEKVFYHNGKSQYKMLLQGYNKIACIEKMEGINKSFNIIPKYILNELTENLLVISE